MKKVLILIFFVAINSISQKVDSCYEIYATENRKRSSEGDFVRLKNGDILFVYSEFTKSHADNSPSYLNSVYSKDSGKSWEPGFFRKFPENINDNLMSVSLLRLGNGEILMLYLKKTDGGTKCIPYTISSRDEGHSWTLPKRLIDKDGFYVVNNDRIVQLPNGRLLVPVSEHYCCNNGVLDPYGAIYCYYSDDNGDSWSKSKNVPHNDKVFFQEPGIVETSDGLKMFIRTNTGNVYESFSPDNGKTWSSANKSTIKSPLSPISIEATEKEKGVMVWNNTDVKVNKQHKRTPLTIAFSADNLRTWTQEKNIEFHPNGHYCYAAIEFIDPGYLLLAYSSGIKEGHLSGFETLKIVRLDIREAFNRK